MGEVVIMKGVLHLFSEDSGVVVVHFEGFVLVLEVLGVLVHNE